MWVPMEKQTAHYRFLHDPEQRCTMPQMKPAGNNTTFFVFHKLGKMKQLEGETLSGAVTKDQAVCSLQSS